MNQSDCSGKTLKPWPVLLDHYSSNICSILQQPEGFDIPINSPFKVGQILACNYGNYLKDEKGDIVSTAVDAHIPPGMIKYRLVVKLNGRLNGNACIVVPISTTKDPAKLNNGLHVELSEGGIKAAKYFSQTTS